MPHVENFSRLPSAKFKLIRRPSANMLDTYAPRPYIKCKQVADFVPAQSREEIRDEEKSQEGRKESQEGQVKDLSPGSIGAPSIRRRSFCIQAPRARLNGK